MRHKPGLLWGCTSVSENSPGTYVISLPHWSASPLWSHGPPVFPEHPLRPDKTIFPFSLSQSLEKVLLQYSTLPFVLYSQIIINKLPAKISIPDVLIPRAVTANYHKLSGFKQEIYSLTILEAASPGSKCQQDCIPSEPRGAICSLPLPASGGSRRSLAWAL